MISFNGAKPVGVELVEDQANKYAKALEINVGQVFELISLMKSMIVFLLLLSCKQVNRSDELKIANDDSIATSDTTKPAKTQPLHEYSGGNIINTGNTTPAQLLSFAYTLIGTPYKYASTDPKVGFDCSGFITYVFNHFNIAVPRSSVDFTNVEYTIPLSQAKPGDLILFTGTDSTIRTVGHMGIITSAQDNKIQFIHSTSGKANGVTITPLNDYYKGRFVKIIHVFTHSD